MPDETDYRKTYGGSTPPDSDRLTTTHDAYELTFYPGFARRCSVQTDSREVLLYEQREPYVLPPGEMVPRAEHEVQLRGGPNQQDLRLQIIDPGRRVARIIVELYTDDLPVGSSHAREGLVEALIVENRAMLCPPLCL